MLFDIHKGAWEPWLCELFDIPESMLPAVRPSSSAFGITAAASPASTHGVPGKAQDLPPIPAGIPICGVAGDQQSALFGQCCTQPGQAKNTYGTGCFLLMHTGHEAIRSRNNLVTTIAASAPGTVGLEYALEGSVFMAGALIQWLRDEVGLIETAAESEAVATSVPDTAGVYVVPAFTGLGAPYWDAAARGAIYGLTRGAGRAHIVRASLESLAYQVSDLMRGMEDDAGIRVESLAVDGGACRNNFLMQFQSDILNTTLVRPVNAETTAAGAAYLAGLETGFWKSPDDIRARRAIELEFTPTMSDEARAAHLSGWADCIARTRTTARA
jgi:glycerol kinase